MFIAIERGYFSQESLEVKLDYSGSAQNVAITVAAGEADFGVTSLTADFFNLAGKGSLKIIAGQYQEKQGWPGAAYLACNTAYEQSLNSPQLLSGKKLAMTQPGSTFHR